MFAAHRVSSRAVYLMAATVVALTLSASFLSTPALAASASVSIVANGSSPQPSGQASGYTINFTCSAVSGNTCGSNPTITIPLDLTSSSPDTPAMNTWAYSASSSISGLISSAAVVGGDYVITLDETKLSPGASDTVTLNVTPPNNITPGGTTWSLDPSFQTDSIASVPAPTPASGGASASTHLSVSKNTNDGGSVYVIGNDVTYTIKVGCNTGSSTGNLYLTDGSLVDTLPSYMTYVSSTPTATSSPTGAGGQVSWSYSNLPPGCSGTGATSATFTLRATLDAGTPDNQQVVNGVQLSGIPIGASTPDTTNASKTITAVDVPPSNPGAFVGKTSLGPLNVPGLGFHGTYAGHWIPTVNPAPSASSPGAAEGQYTVLINYNGASGAYETDLAEPVPCLDNVSGVVYSSSSPSGAINGAGSIDNLCQNPAFDPTVVQVNSFGLATAVTGGWTPIGIRPDGSTFSLTLHGSASTSAYFEIPAADVGNVAAIELPQNASLTDPSMSMTVWGYGDPSLQGGDDLRDVATATAYPTSGTNPPTTANHSADLYIEPSDPQLGVFKSWGSLNGGPGGTTTVNLQGTLALNSTPSADVILTDLLPYGLSWSNPTTTANFAVSASQGTGTTTVAATVTDTQNFNSTGRELIRVDLPASAFTTGFYTLTAPANFIEIHVPSSATTYTNTDQEFIKSIGQATASTCGPGSGTTASTFESSDPSDLDGDGQTNENYCQYAATLTVPPSGGPAFTLTKSVQGDLDSAPKFSPGIGIASQAGSGVYTLQWSNTGGTTLTAPVVYDILPYIGDTGVSEGQATTPRDSAFAPTFGGLQGALPANVSAAYSESTNPCRTEVYPDADNPSCVNDWIDAAGFPASDLSLVKAIRLTATGNWAAASSFSVSLKVNVPGGFVNTVAWNTAASDAKFNGTPLLPAEPPKVGLQAPAPPVTPTLSTVASASQTQPGDSIFDTITVGNTGGGTGTLDWSLVGPVSPASGGTCTGLNWSGAPTLASGTIPVTGNGSFTTAGSAPTGAGCYSYVEHLSGSLYAGPVDTAAGTVGETVLVHAAELSTSVSAARILPGGSVTDAVTLAGRGVGAGTLDWSVVGPIPAAPDGTCAGLDWSTAAVADHGSLTVTGDGGYETPASTLSATGCYSYVQLLTDSSVGGPATSPAGGAGETVLVAQPQLSTAVSAASILAGGSTADQIAVSGTGGQPGSLAWSLVGPVDPNASGTCAGVDWSGAPTLASGTLAVSGDSIYQTPDSAVKAAGCYGYAVTLTGAAYGGPVTSTAGSLDEIVLVEPPSAASARVVVNKQVNDSTAAVGQKLTYTLTARNTGRHTATNVRITDAPKTRMKLISVTPSSGHCNRGWPLVCRIGRLRPGRRATVTVVAEPLAPGPVGNTAHVQIKQPNAAQGKSTFHVAKTRVRVPLTLTKTAQRQTVDAGARLRYVIVVANRTPSAAARVKLCDALPTGLVFVSASVRTHLRDGSRCWTLASIAAHSQRTFTLTARALDGARGEVVNRAKLTGPLVPARTAVARATVLPKPPPSEGVTG